MGWWVSFKRAPAYESRMCYPDRFCVRSIGNVLYSRGQDSSKHVCFVWSEDNQCWHAKAGRVSARAARCDKGASCSSWLESSLTYAARCVLAERKDRGRILVMSVYSQSRDAVSEKKKRIIFGPFAKRRILSSWSQCANWGIDASSLNWSSIALTFLLQKYLIPMRRTKGLNQEDVQVYTAFICA